MRNARAPRIALRAAVLVYLALLVGGPLVMVFHNAFSHGLGAAWDAISSPPAVHALKLTGLMVAIAVPANTVLGIVSALLLARGPRGLRGPLTAVLALPLAVPPVVVGLALTLLYGRTGWFGPWLDDHGVRVLFAWPSMALASIFISLPFVAREVAPVLEEIGTEQEEAARTLGASAWQAFRMVTLPGILPALGYGIVLTTARVVGEFGAVSVVSGRLVGQTETLPLFVQDRFDQFDQVGAYSASVLLALIAIAVLALMLLLGKEGRWASTS